MAEEKGMEWKEMQLLLQGELQRMSERLSKDLRRELSSALSHWLEQPKHLAWRKKEEESNALSPRAKEASPQLPPQLPYSPTLSTSTPMAVSMNDERDIARMRMKARTYVSTEGIGGPVATGSMTLIGTPKSQTGRGFAFSRSASSAIDVGTLDEVDEGEPENLKVVPDAPPDAGNKKDKRDSRAMSEPRSIFVHHISRYAPEEAGTAETPESPTSSSKSSFSRCNFLQQKCLWLVRLEAFDYIMGLAILANAILMGVQADLAVHSARTGELEPPAVRAVAVVLGVIFTVELVLRIFAFRLDFFTKPGWKWNIFDFTLVFLQISEEVVTAVVYTDSTSRTVNLSFMRILRVLRLVRIVRLVRVLRLIRELRTLVESIASTMTSLLWTVVLLLLLIFVVGICFTQVVADVATESPQLLQEGTDTFEFYGSLMRSVMSLYQSITSGVSWREASVPLERHSAVMGLVFAVYIAFAALAMLNVITGVFVESAMASAREENTVTVVSRMREIVHQMKIGDSGQMTWEQFEGQLDNPVMEAYFKSIDLSVTEARSLFLLLDIDDQGYIDVEEFIAGCCRIHGPAKAIDLTTLMCQVRKLHMELREHALWVVECMTMAGFASPASTFQGSPRHRRKPSFGLTAHPDHALEEKSPVASLDHKVHASPASSIEQAPEALSALTPAGSLKLPINNRLHDEGFGGFENVTQWAKKDTGTLLLRESGKPLSL